MHMEVTKYIFIYFQQFRIVSKNIASTMSVYHHQCLSHQELFSI